MLEGVTLLVSSTALTFKTPFFYRWFQLRSKILKIDTGGWIIFAKNVDKSLRQTNKMVCKKASTDEMFWSILIFVDMS